MSPSSVYRSLTRGVGGVRRLTVGEHHLAIIRRFNWTWGGGDYGAVGVDTKRPLGNGDFLADVGKLIGLVPGADQWGDPHWSEVDAQTIMMAFAEACVAVEILSERLSLEPGSYIKRGYGATWERE